MSINELTISMVWIAGLAVVALVLAGWRKTARASPKPPRRSLESPKRVPFQLTHVVTEPYRPPGALRRAWAVVASSGLAIVAGAVIATITAFAVAFLVITLTDLLRQ